MHPVDYLKLSFDEMRILFVRIDEPLVSPLSVHLQIDTSREEGGESTFLDFNRGMVY